METLRRLVRDDDGATMVEYGLLVALIAVAAITAIKLVGTNLSTLFNNVAEDLVEESSGSGS
ncbi:MAG: Flp family type IVb pilin [Firmicutes bacterium]|nr:Flp family type IVb pilin [Bacillota bacterium]